MAAQAYITSVCKIFNGLVYKNGAQLFQNEGPGFNDFLLSVYQHFNIKYPKFYKMDNMSKAGFLAAEILLAGSMDPGKYKPEDAGLIFSNANSSLDTDVKYFATAKEIASPALFVYTLPNIVMGEICIRHHFKGENTFFIAESFDADFIHDYIKDLLNNDTLQVCICGWIDVLDNEYKIVLVLVEKDEAHSTGNATASEIFTVKNLRKYIN